MKTLVIAAITALSLMVPVSGYADFTCGELHEKWESYLRVKDKVADDDAKDVFASMMYMGYVMGVSETLHLTDFLSISWPKDGMINPKQNHYIVGKWLENNPSEWGKSSLLCIALAFIDAYGVDGKD